MTFHLNSIFNDFNGNFSFFSPKIKCIGGFKLMPPWHVQIFHAIWLPKAEWQLDEIPIEIVLGMRNGYA